ncbi:hypothetical protein C8D90_106285 [Enterobacillus tribolii]|uniref:Uncharacterized protein n=1 Tax=Enterobacillus tribolii TaxID=1487935 RepID=A0A370QNX3_9GAMM|nr:hypothetical protein C8D90_106285 [Enterobacillus tribolii]
MKTEHDPITVKHRCFGQVSATVPMNFTCQP